MIIGRIISHYKIIEEIGAGGMGVVYRAEDTRLGRAVALKFLSPELSRDEDAKSRFIQEAKAISLLDHNNICTIYEISETDDGQLFIAMAFYEGETLKEKMILGGKAEQSTLSLNEAINYISQVAKGLAKAHEKGIFHRDIKPANIIITKDGVAKILDFGLAKLAGQSRLTKEGTTLGTIAYMSPEQTGGEITDQRTDIWALGVLFYELLTGQLPFKGEYDQAIMYSILNVDPITLKSHNENLPEYLQDIIDKMLDKSPKERYQHINDFMNDLRPQKKLNESTKDRSKKKKWLMAILGIGILAIISLLFREKFFDERKSPAKYTTLTSFPGEEIWPSFSPDGKQIAFVHRDENTQNNDIFVQFLGTNESLNISTSTENEVSPCWSPDGSQIAYILQSSDPKDEGIYTISALGGTRQKIYSGNFHGLDWSPDGELLVFTNLDSSKSIFLLNLKKRQLQRLTRNSTSTGDIGHWKPTFSPDGREIAFIFEQSSYLSDIYTVAVERGKPKRISFDERHIFYNALAWNPNGPKIVFASNRGGNDDYRLWQIHTNGGNIEPLASSGRQSMGLAISKDGNKLVYSESSKFDRDIWRVAIADSLRNNAVPTKLIYSNEFEQTARYSPEGKRIAYDSKRSGVLEIWTCDSDGKNQIQLTSMGKPSGSAHWSPNGTHIAFDSRPDDNSDIFIIDSNGGVPKRLTSEPSEDVLPSWSSDAEWIYFTSDRSGDFQIWKMPSVGGKATQITKEGGFIAFESNDGKWLYYSKQKSSPIWKIPVMGGEKISVLDSVTSFGRWTLNKHALYYFKPIETGGTILNRVDLSTFKTKTIFKFQGSLLIAAPNVSPDDNWLLYFQNDPVESDIILVENWQ